MMSGWDVNDAFEHVRKHAWAFRANRTIKATDLSKKNLIILFIFHWNNLNKYIL